MSRRTSEASKAIRKAWEREQDLVRVGKGTRDWTKQQQEDILNPDKGKAYDEDGKAFEGQHMKCVDKYPEHQGNPDNIQFLTKKEHLEAHKGAFRNHTNWYYDYVNKTYEEFSDDVIIPCKTIELSNPINIIVESTGLTNQVDNTSQEEGKKEETTEKKIPPSDTQRVYANSVPIDKKTPKAVTQKATWGSKLLSGMKKVGKFVIEHPVETAEIAITVLATGYEVVSTIREHNSSTRGLTDSHTDSRDEKKSVASKISDIVEKANNSSVIENDVRAHRQRYHTKDGIIWKDKDSYHRGGNNTD